MLLGFYNYLVFYCGMSVVLIKNDDDGDDGTMPSYSGKECTRDPINSTTNRLRRRGDSTVGRPLLDGDVDGITNKR